MQEEAEELLKRLLEKYPFAPVRGVQIAAVEEQWTEEELADVEVMAGWYNEEYEGIIFLSSTFVPDASQWWVEDKPCAFFLGDSVTLETVITHEFGHLIYNGVKELRVGRKKTKTLVNEAYKDREFVSLLAEEDPDEYFAELFVKFSLAPERCTEAEKNTVKLVLGKYEV